MEKRCIESDHKNIIFVTKEDRVYCLGKNRNGILGLGHKKEVEECTEIKELSNQKINHLVNGYDSVLALNQQKELFVFGSNKHGQLGKWPNSGDYYLSPQKISFFKDKRIKDITCGYNHTMVLLFDGLLYGWGYNGDYRLGFGKECIETPTKLVISETEDLRFKYIQCFGNHSFAITTNGNVYSFGDNRFGQLGQGVDDDECEPRKISLMNVEKISLTLNNSYFLTNDGSIYFCGEINIRTKQRTPVKMNVDDYIFHDLIQLNSSEVVIGQNSKGSFYVFKYDQASTLNANYGSLIELCAKEYQITPQMLEITNNNIVSKGLQNTSEQIQILPLDQNKSVISKISSKINANNDIVSQIYQETPKPNQMLEITADNKIVSKQYQATTKQIQIIAEEQDKTLIAQISQDTIKISRLELNSIISTQVSNQTFQIKNKIGAGGFGEVYKFYNDLDEQFYAIKKIDINACGWDFDYVIREVRNIVKLQSCYIVRYYNSWRKDDNLFIQMEYCSDNLKTILEKKPILFNRIRNEPMNSIEYYISCEIFRQIIEALNYLHSLPKPLIHRDLKPDNILIGNNGFDIICKLADFGLSKFIDNLPEYHSRNIGAPKYIAPEILSGNRYDTKADIFSLGISGLEILEYTNDKSIGLRYDNSYFRKKLIEFENTLINKMPTPAAYNRPSCKELLEIMKNWCIEPRQIKADPQYTRYLDKFKTDCIYFNHILCKI